MAQVILLTDVTQGKSSPGWGRAIGAYVLASKARRAGYSTVVIDSFTRLENVEEILRAAIGPETLFVGLSGTFLSKDDQLESLLDEAKLPEYGSGFLWCDTLSELEAFIAMIRSIVRERGAGPDTPVVLGGTKALFFLQSDEMRPLFDFYVVGKGESFFVDMLQLLSARQPLPFKDHNGGRFTHEGLFAKTTDTIESLLWEKSDGLLPTESLPIEIAKGCLYNCKFCYYEKQGSLRQNVETLKTELIRNYEQFGVARYSFSDDCFNDTRPKVEEICNAIFGLPFKIEWVSYARVDVACKFPHTLDLMIESGCRGIFWGLETFNHAIGREIGKGTDPALVKQMLIDARLKHGDRCIMMGSFIVGLPGETEASIRETFDWIMQSRALDLVYAPVLSVRPYSERLDKAVVDYADFSRNPAKYGFTKVEFDPHTYWEHDTMNRPRAYELRSDLTNQLKSVGISNSFIKSIFQYPHLRDLGMSHEDIVHAIRHARYNDPLHRKVVEDQQREITNYGSRVLNYLTPAESTSTAFF